MQFNRARNIFNSSSLGRNITYVRQQFYAAVKSTSFVVKVICSLVVFCYILSFLTDTVRILSVTPGYLVPPNFWVWTAFSFCFLETKFWLVLADVLTVGLCGKLLEPLWGTFEMFTFFALVNTSVAFMSVMFYIVLFTITSDTSYLFSVHINGLAGYCAGVAVAVKQLMPQHVLLSTPVGKLKNKDVPLCILILSLCFWPFGIVSASYPIMFSSGIIASWVYLRFYQHHSNGTHGDPSTGFTFSSFFPSILQTAMDGVGSFIFRLFVYLRICKKRKERYSLISSPSANFNLPEVDCDTERRRQIALRALSERLSKAEQISSSSEDSEQHLLVEGLSVSIPMPLEEQQIETSGSTSTSIASFQAPTASSETRTSSSK